MSKAGSGQPHANDGALVRLLDGELDGAVAGSLRAHLKECAGCAGRLDQLRATGDRLDGMLAASAAALGAGRPHPVSTVGPASRSGAVRRPTGPGPVWWRVAAVLAVLLGLGALAPPVRAWVAGRVAGLMEREGGVPEVRVEASTAGAALIRVAPAGSRLVVDVADVDPSGVLEVRRRDGVDAVLELPSPGADVVVGSQGFRLEGGPPGATYRLGVPAGVESVVLRDLATGGEVHVPVPASGATKVPIRP
jgi:hypothetical protein